MIVVSCLYVMLNGSRRLRAQNAMLLVASYVFYGFWDYRFLFLIMLSTAVDFVCGLAIAGQIPSRRSFFTLGCALLAGCLFLCAPIDWSAIGSMIRPGDAAFGGWSSPAGSHGLTVNRNWSIFVGACAASLVVGFLCITGLRLRGDARCKYYLALSVTCNLTLLGFFKYFDFFVGSASTAISNLGLGDHQWQLGIVVPVGISFYTFQTLSYSIDIYRGLLKPTRNLLDFALFVAFFPQLVAGPIERASVLLPQLEKPRRFDKEAVLCGLYLVCWGLFKKIFIADNLARFVEPAFALDASPTGPQVLFSTYAFAFQIYCDFSGYSDIARGISRCMGIELMVNFNVPYAALNPREFWRRWHISLSTWLRDYLYISLGGNRGGAFFVYRNLILTMLLGGLWHGARAHFVWWGLYQGFLLCGHRLLEPYLEALSPKRRLPRLLVMFVSWFFFFHLVCYGWLLFRAETWSQIAGMTTALTTGWGAIHSHLGILFRVVWFGWPLILVQIAQTRSQNLLAPLTWPWPARMMLYLLMFYLTVVLGSFDEVEFIYFQF